MDVNAAEDFLEIVVTGHVLSAALTYLGISLHMKCHQRSTFQNISGWKIRGKDFKCFLTFQLVLSILWEVGKIGAAKVPHR